MTTGRVSGRLALVALVPLALALSACERPPQEVEQTGYRGTGMQNPENPRIREANAAKHEAPEASPRPPSAGPKAGDIYQNVKVLEDLSVAQFQRVMRGITQWVSPEQGCNYCHVPGNFAAEDKYQKRVSRQMIEMTQSINSKWTPHVGVNNTGVTCYTCHRGKNVPEYIWFHEPEDDMFTQAGNRYMQNKPVEKTGFSSLPRDALTEYLQGYQEQDPYSIRVQSQQALPGDNKISVKQTEKTYSLMVHMSRSLGVSCNVCHNSRAFGSWEQSPPQRTTAWHGIRMARDINDNHLSPLTDWFPQYRLGPEGDVGKVSCATCHQGIQKPLYGAKMAKDYPSLIGEGSNLLEASDSTKANASGSAGGESMATPDG